MSDRTSKNHLSLCSGPRSGDLGQGMPRIFLPLESRNTPFSFLCSGRLTTFDTIFERCIKKCFVNLGEFLLSPQPLILAEYYWHLLGLSLAAHLSSLHPTAASFHSSQRSIFMSFGFSHARRENISSPPPKNLFTARKLPSVSLEDNGKEPHITAAAA